MQITKHSIWNSSIEFPHTEEGQVQYADVVSQVVDSMPTYKTSWLTTFTQAINAQVGKGAMQAADKDRKHISTRFYIWTQHHPNWGLVLKVISLGTIGLLTEAGRARFDKHACVIRIASLVDTISRTITDRNNEVYRLGEQLIKYAKKENATFSQVQTKLSAYEEKAEVLSGYFVYDFTNALMTHVKQPQTYQDPTRYKGLTAFFSRFSCNNGLIQLRNNKQVYEEAGQWDELSRNHQKRHIEQLLINRTVFAPLIEERVEHIKTGLVWERFKALSTRAKRAFVEDAKSFNLQRPLDVLIKHVRDKLLPTLTIEQLDEQDSKAMMSLLGLQDEAKRFYAFLEGRAVARQIRELEEANQEGWQEVAITLIRNSRKDNPELELQRLKGAGAVTNSESDKIKNTISLVKLTNEHKRAALSKQAILLYTQAYEIKRIYEKTHHIFLHAQSIKWSIVPMLIKELVELVNPEKKFHHYKFLRREGIEITDGYFDMLSSYVTNFVKSIFGFGKKDPATAREFLDHYRSLGKKINDDELDVREKILSIDGCFDNYQEWESAPYFLMKNDNVLDGGNQLKKIIISTLRHFKKSASIHTVETLANKLLSSTNFTNALTTTGNLYVIAVPKEKSADFQYRAHPYGPACTCHPGEHQEVLERLQDGQLDGSTMCTLSKTPIPQYRLYLPAVKPEAGIKMFRLNALNREGSHAIKTSVKEVANSLLA